MFSKIMSKSTDTSNCQICKAEFNLLKLSYRCKRCNKYICIKCGNFKQKIVDEDGVLSEDHHRVCIECNTELNKIKALIEQKNIKWATDSLIAQQWINRIKAANTKNKGSKTKDYEYQHFLKLFLTNIKNFEDDAEIIEKDVINGRTDYYVFNYSMRQFFYIVQQIDIRQKTRKNMANVLYAIAARFDQIGYVQGMSSVAAFLLCFCSEESAYIIFCDLIENIFPHKFLEKGNYGINLIGLLAQTHFLKQYFIHILTKVKQPLLSHYRMPYTQQDIQQFRLLVSLSTSKALLSMFVNFLSYSHISFLWNELSHLRNFEVAEKGFLAALYLRREHLLERRSYKELQSLFEGIDLQQFIQAYHDIQIDSTLKSKLIQQFYQSQQRKWADNSLQNIKQLHRYTNFTEQQIKLLQDKFVKIRRQSNGQGMSGVINKRDFVLLIKCYYDILKENAENQAPILEVTQHFVEKIFDSFVANKIENKTLPKMKKSKSQQVDALVTRSQIKADFQKNVELDFKQFVCCFSLCAKSLLKDRMCAIIKTFENRHKKIPFYSFQKLIKNLCEIAPLDIEDKKKAFLQRMHRYCSNQQDGINMNQLSILMNDSFINELTVYIRSDAPGIISKTVQKFLSVRENTRG